jgi:hypothetical protein
MVRAATVASISLCVPPRDAPVARTGPCIKAVLSRDFVCGDSAAVGSECGTVLVKMLELRCPATTMPTVPLEPSYNTRRRSDGSAYLPDRAARR